MRDFSGDRRGSAAHWFALAAAVIGVSCVAGAQALDWLSQSGRISVVAYRAPAAPARVAADPNIDTTPTGSIPSTPSTAVMIRLR